MDLAYTVAVGKRRYGWAGRLALDSLGRWGGFSGRLVLLTDRRLTAPAGVEVMTLPAARVADQANRMKMLARQYLDFAAYERVLFIDADILVRGSVTNFLAACQDGVLACTDDLRNPITAGHCFRALSDAELAANAERLGVNGGLFAAEGPAMVKHLATWHQALETLPHRPGPGFDMPSLNACVLRGLIPSTMVPGIMWFPGRDPDAALCDPDAPFVHYHGIGRHLNRYWRMRRHYRDLLKQQR